MLRSQLLRHPFALILLALMLSAGLALGARAARAANPSPVAAAWQQARTSGGYRFASEITQTLTPSATVANVGRTSRVERARLEGHADLLRHALDMHLWSDSGSLVHADSGIAVRVADGKTMIRRGDEPWQESDGLTEALAPQGDLMAYMAAVRDVTSHGSETRAGLTFTRYSFTIDGPTFAGYMRDQLEAAMRRKGELPLEAHLDVPAYYAQMTGDGELWVRTDGLPLRQILDLRFPEQAGERTSAHISVDFSDFAPAGAAWPLGPIDAGRLTGWAANLASLALATALALVLIRCYASRRLNRALAIFMIVSLTSTPLLNGLKINSLMEVQAARAAEQEQQRSESRAVQQARSQAATPSFDPHADALAASAGLPAAPAMPPGVSDDGVSDTDHDGLTDSEELRIGTDPAAADSDGDLIDDSREVRGFSYAGKHWFSDPLKLDSNLDGRSDTAEWNLDRNSDTLPDDTDSDGTPDLFDADDDNDGVPDRKDLAPMVARTAFSQNAAFKLSIEHLTPNTPVFVDFQLRPSNPDHLWFAQNVLDWPADKQAQLQDADGATWGDIARAAGRAADPAENYGDMKLVPMLELRFSAANGNLPPAADLAAYNVSVSRMDAAGSQLVAYVPLTIQTDEQTGARVAFQARMPYRAAAAGWGQPHEARLVWMIQMLADDCKQSANGICSEYNAYNRSQVVQTYYDSWTLTGLNVREDHGTDLSIIYKDPAADPDLNDDHPLWALAAGLENAFLSPRDANGDGQRDMPIGEITRRFDHAGNAAVSADERWAIPNILNVESRSYAHLDLAIVTTAMTETKRILETRFSPRWSNANPIKPLLMFAREERLRAIGLDASTGAEGYAALNGDTLSVDFQPVGQSALPVNITTALKWTPYCATPGAGNAPGWSACKQEAYWAELERRNPPENATDEARGQVVVVQLYFLALSNEATAIVQRGSQIEVERGVVMTDSAIAAVTRESLVLGRRATVFLMNAYVMGNQIDKTSTWQYLGRTFNKLVNGVTSLPRRLFNAIGITNQRAIVAGVIILVGAIAVGVALLVKYYLAGDPAAQLAANIVIKTLITGLATYFSLVRPVMTAIGWVQALQAAGYTSSQALRTVLTAESTLVGTTRTASVIGAIIGIAITWGFFIYAVVSSKISAFSPEFNALLAETIAATIYLILITMLAASVVGLIIVGIIALIDGILTAICELGVSDLRKAPGMGGSCFTIGGAAIKIIAKLIYAFDPMIDTSRNDMIVMGQLDVSLAEPLRGYVAGNPLQASMPLTTTVTHQRPSPENVMNMIYYLGYYSQSNLTSSTFRYSLSRPDPEEISVGRSEMTGEWQNVHINDNFLGQPLYQGQKGQVLTLPSPVNFAPGLNQKLDFYFNMGYAIPAYECWGIAFISACYKRTLDGNSSTKIDMFQFDILPGTLDDFMATTDRGDGGLRLAWDNAFRSIYDADGDGLPSAAYGGFDDDTSWDRDHDGLSDRFELERRAAGVGFDVSAWDTDGDGLTDQQELELGTHPARRDTDNDGLSDAEELYHPVYTYNTAAKQVQPTGAWAGGWDVAVSAGLTVHVSSDPTVYDSDDDGLSDLAERQLAQGAPAGRSDPDGHAYHPLVFNRAPVIIRNDISDPDRIVAPGQTFTYTTTVASAGPALAPGALDIAAPSVLGGTPAPARLDFSVSQTVTVQAAMTVRPDAATGSAAISSTARLRLADQAGSPWSWNVLNESPLGGFTRQAHYTSAAASQPDRQDSYVLASLTADTFDSNGRAAGDIVAHARTGGQVRTLDNDTTTYYPYYTFNAPYWTHTYYDGAYRRSDHTPQVACDNSGHCTTVWDQYDNCGILTINSLAAPLYMPAGSLFPFPQDAGWTADIAVYFSPDPNDTDPSDGGYDLIYAVNDINTAGRTNPWPNLLPISRWFCGTGRISIYEWDGNLNTPNWGGSDPDIDPVGSFTVSVDSATQTYHVENSTDGGYVQTDTNVAIGPQQRQQIAAAISGADLAAQRGQFVLAQGGDPNTRDFNPVIASDGSSFLVAWERTIGAQSQVIARRYDSFGNPLAAEQVLATESHTDTSSEWLMLNAAWIGDRYRVIWHMSGQAQLRRADVQANGSLIAGSLTSFGTNVWAPIAEQPGLAYDPMSGHSVVAYSTNAGNVNATLFQNSADAGSERQLVARAAYPSIAYQPTTGGWLLSSYTWASQYQYEALKPDLTPLLAAGSRQTLAWSNTVSNLAGTTLACPLPQSAPALELAFEELPGATSFADGSAYARTIAAAPGSAPTAGAIGAGARVAPYSDYAAAFDGAGQSLNIARAVQGDFSIALWLNTTQASGTAGLIDGEAGAGANDYSLTLSNGRVRFAVGNPDTAVTSPASLADGQWHYLVATRSQASGTIALYLDGNPSPVASAVGGTQALDAAADLRVGALRGGGGFFNGRIDQLSLFAARMSGQTVSDRYNRTFQSHCLTAAPATGALPWARLDLRKNDLRGGTIVASSRDLALTIDADRPSSAIDSLHDGQYVRRPDGGTLIIGGSANDATSGVVAVDVRVNGGAWQRASGAATWSYALTLAEGSYTIESRAVDAVGNTEVPRAPITIVADQTAPQLGITPTSAPIVPTHASDGRWVVRLGGIIVDPPIGARPGSGVMADSIELLVAGAPVLDAPQGNRWQVAALQGNTWSIDYVLPYDMPDPTGVYSVSVRATDQVGNRTPELVVPTPLRLDIDRPGAAIGAADATTTIVTSTLTLSGVISDTAGVADLSAAFVPIDQVVILSHAALLLPFDEPAGAEYFADSTVQHNDVSCATPGNCPAAGAAGRFNGALQFANGALLRGPAAVDLDFDPSAGFSLQAWVKTSGAGVQRTARLLVKRAGAQGYSLQLQNGAVAALELNGVLVASGGPDLRDNQWHQIVGVVDRETGQARLYVDGVLRDTRPFTGGVANPAAIEIGGWSGQAGNSYTGALDQAGIFRRAMSPEEVRVLYETANASWQPATLAQSGPGATDTGWSIAVPQGVENQFQLDMRSGDTLGNRAIVPNVWRGIIDNRAPRIDLRVAATGAAYLDTASNTMRYAVTYQYSAEDRHLSDAGFSGPCDSQGPPSRDFDKNPILRELFPDWTFRNLLAAACTKWEPAGAPPATVRACDIYGNCSEAITPTPTGDGVSGAPAATPVAVITSPSDLSYIASDGTLNVTIAAEASAGLHEIVVLVNGTPADRLRFAQGANVTRVQSSVRLSFPAEGRYTIAVQASDWLGAAQPAIFPVDVWIDLHNPAISLAASVVRQSDGYDIGSGIIRFSGVATDSVGLAAAQLKIGNGAFQDVTLNPDGSWATAQPLGNDSQGQTFEVTVRAIDKAGRISDTTRSVLIDLVPPAQLTTRILAQPVNPSMAGDATFAFDGSDGNGNSLSTFECSLDGAAYAPCSSPQSYSVLADGTHTFQVRSKDGGGNVDATPASYSWAIDRSLAIKRLYLPVAQRN